MQNQIKKKKIQQNKAIKRAEIENLKETKPLLQKPTNDTPQNIQNHNKVQTTFGEKKNA